MYVNCFDKHEEPQKTETKERECVYRRIFPSRSIDFYQYKILPNKALVNMTQMDVLSPRMFCPHRRFVRWMFCPTDVLSPRMFCPMDVLSLRMFCPHGRFVPTDVLSTDVLSPDVLSPDVLSGHTKDPLYVDRPAALSAVSLSWLGRI
jgi:hypothetical protein